MFQTIDVTINGRIGHITLNSPKNLNALSVERLTELAQAARWFNEQSDVRVVIVTGQGRAFCGGADLKSFGGETAVTGTEAADAGRRMADAIENMRAITIVGIQGWCVGGGLVLAAACDFRIAAEDARFSIPEVDLGIPLAWGGIPRLIREIGPNLTRELVLTCRPFDAVEAKQAGLLNKIVSNDTLNDEIEQLAQSLATKAAMPLFATKQHINAVTSQMVGTANGWSDASALIAAFVDPECQSVRQAYLERVKK